MAFRDDLDDLGDETSPWPAFADLLSATTLLFLILFAVIAVPAIKRAVAAEGDARRAAALQTALDSARAKLSVLHDQERVEVRQEDDYLIVTIPERAVFGPMLFQLSDLRSAGRDILREVGQAISADPQLLESIDQIQVVGHTSAEGSEELNWRLSAARAATVALFLIDSAGMNPCSVSALGRSKYYPVNPVEQRQRRTIVAGDRRIELEIRPAVVDKQRERRRGACVGGS